MDSRRHEEPEPRTATPLDLRAALEASEARFRNIIEKNADGVLVIDHNGTIQYVNPAAERLMGRPGRDLIGASFGVPIVPGETTELDLPCPNGESLVVEMRAVETEWEGGVALLASLRDVTGRKRAEEMVRAAEERFRQITEAISDFTYSLRFEDDGRWTLEWLTEVFHRLSGYHAEEVRVLGWTHLVHPDDHEIAYAHAMRILSGVSESSEFRIINSSGEVRWLRNTARPIRSPFDDRISRIYGAGQDITERRRLQVELHRRVDELAELDRRKDEFLAMMAHELRNPLAPIRNAVNVLRRVEDSSISDHMHDIIGHQVDHLARLLDDLLDVTRITRGKIRLRPEPTDVAAVIGRAVEPLRPLFAEHQLSLTVVTEEAPLWTEADPTRLQQVISNLLHNALKYTDPDGAVHLELKRDDSEIVIQVRDTGIGIDSEMLPRVFDPFSQADSSLDRARGGLGIGLTLAQRLVQMHGGGLTASSQGLGRGSEFTVRLPLKKPAQSPTGRLKTADEPLPFASGDRSPILVVDDNVDAATSLAVLLKIWGHEAVVVHDGPEAIEVAQRSRPEVVLLDIGLPKLDGYQVASTLRKELGLKDSKIIAMTGYGQAEDRRRSQEAGFDFHLVKPIDLEQLESILAESTRRVTG